MENKYKEWIRFLSGIVCLIGGIVLSFISLYLPPIGIIDGSVLILIGEVLTFVGALWGLHDFTILKMKQLDNRINNRGGE